MPPNLQTVSLKFARRRSAKVMGSLADSNPTEGEQVQGVLVTHNFHSKIVSPHDLATYTPLRVGSIQSKLHVPFAGSIETLRLFLNEMFAGVTEEDTEIDSISCKKFSLHDNKVTLLVGKTKGVVTVEWEASPAGDVVADALIALLMHSQSSAASIRLSSKPCRHPRPADDDNTDEPSSKKTKEEDGENVVESRLRLIKDVLAKQFQQVEAVYEGNIATYEIISDSGLETSTALEDGKLTCAVKVQFTDKSGSDAEVTVECIDKKLASAVQTTLRNLARTLGPLKV